MVPSRQKQIEMVFMTSSQPYKIFPTRKTICKPEEDVIKMPHAKFYLLSSKREQRTAPPSSEKQGFRGLDC
jgi:hypothetical protein